jgi:metal-dependent amidase/aminoacylase/carboxypeptidase family protein
MFKWRPFQWVPEEASVWLWIRDSKKKRGKLSNGKRMIMLPAALMAGVEYEIKLNNGLYELLTNETGAKHYKTT